MNGESLGQEKSGEVKADEAGCSGYEDMLQFQIPVQRGPFRPLGVNRQSDLEFYAMRVRQKSELKEARLLSKILVCSDVMTRKSPDCIMVRKSWLLASEDCRTTFS